MCNKAIKPIWTDGDFLEVSYKLSSKGVHLYSLWFNGVWAGTVGYSHSEHPKAAIHSLVASFLARHHLTTNQPTRAY